MKHTMKKLLSLILAFSMVMSLAVVPVGAAAAKNQVVNEGGTSYYKADGSTGSANDYAVALTKTATAVSGRENEFDITLQVDTTLKQSENIKISNTPDAAVVLTVDLSGTMARGTIGSKTRIAVAREEVLKFIASYSASAGSSNAKRMLAVVGFDTDAYTILNWVDVNPNNNPNYYNDSIVPIYNTYSKCPGTSTTKSSSGDRLDVKPCEHSYSKYYGDHSCTNFNGGVLLTKNLLGTSGVDAAHSWNIFLSDGAPTVDIRSSANTSSTTLIEGDYWDSKSGGGKTDKDEVEDTLGHVRNLAAKAHVNFIGVCVDTDPKVSTGTGAVTLTPFDNWSTITPATTTSTKTSQWLSALASDSKVNGTYNGITDSAGLQTEFNKILSDIATKTSTTTIYSSAWNAVDPVGGSYTNNVAFLGFFKGTGSGTYTKGAKSLTKANDGDKASLSSNVINWDLKESTPDSITINGKSGQRYTIKYRVRLTTEASGFSTGSTYNTNGDTKFSWQVVTNNVFGSAITKNFLVPAVKGFVGNLSFTKKDTGGNPLGGATFKLTHNSDCFCGTTSGWASGWPRTVTSANGTGAVAFDNIPSGHVYTLEETAAPTGYHQNTNKTTVTVSYGTVELSGSLISNGVVTNTPIQIKKDFTVKKVWTGGNVGASEIIVDVVRDQDSEVVATLTLNAANNWQATAEDIDTINTANHSTYTFTAREREGKGYIAVSSSVSFDANNFATLTNTRTGTTVVTLQKDWVNTPAKFKTEVTLRLLQDGNTYADYTLNSSNGWVKTVSDLPSYDSNGAAYTYTVVELEGSNAKTNGATITLGGETFTVGISGYTVTNTFNMPKTSVSGTKTWKADPSVMNAADLSATVTLYANGQPTDKTTTVTGSNISYRFDNLDKYDADGNIIDYTVVETAVCAAPEGDSWLTTYSSNSVTNTLTGKVDIAGEKIWDDPDDSERPNSITIQLLKNDSVYLTHTISAFEQTETDEEGNVISTTYTWDGVELDFAFNGLEKYDSDGKLNTYKVREAGEKGGKLVSGSVYYDVTYASDGYDVTNTLNGGEKTVSVQKIWIDAESIHDELTFGIYRADTDEQVDTIILNGTENTPWYVSKNYTKYEDGDEINYYVRELNVDGSVIENGGRYGEKYTVTVESNGNDWTFRNKIDQDYVDVSFQKTWAGQADAVKPATVFTLWKNGQATDLSVTWDESETELWDEAASSGIYTWSTLEKYTFDGDTCIVNQYVVKEDLAGTKALLARYGHDGTTATVLGVADDNGVFQFTNTFTNDTVTVSGRKYWFGMGYTKQIDVGLYVGNDLIAQTKTEGDNFEYSFTGLTKYYNDGTEINYYIRELQDNGDETFSMVLPGEHYTSDGNQYVVRYPGWDIYNTLKQEYVDVHFTKAWRGPVGSGITVELYRDDPADDAAATKIDEMSLTAEAADVENEKIWTDKFDGLPVYNEERTAKYTYTIKEGGTVTEDGSTAATLSLDGKTYVVEMLNEYTIRNTVQDPFNGTFTVNKVWAGDGYTAENGEEVTVQLLIDGKAYSDPVKLNVENGWTYTFENLPLYDDWGDDKSLWTYEPVTYSVVELDQYGRYVTETIGSKISLNEGTERYIVSYDDGTITNTFSDRDSYKYRVLRYYSRTFNGITNNYTDHDVEWTKANKDETVNVDAKQWLDCRTDEHDTVYNYQDSKTSVSQGPNSGYSFDQDNGIVTFVTEKFMDGESYYEVSLYYNFSFTSPNLPAPVITYHDITVKKVWNDGDNAEGLRPESIQVELLENGYSTGNVATLNDANGWSYTWENLSDEYSWSVSEVSVPEGYTASVSRSGNTITITNTYGTDEIQDEDIPMGDFEELPDEDIPLADVPATGDLSAVWMAMSALSGAGLFLIRKKREDEE